MKMNPNVTERGPSASAARVGDVVVAEDGTLGAVERLIVTETSAPAYLVVAVGSRLRRKYPVVPCALVMRTDRARRRVHIRGPRRALGRLPESIPLVF